MSVVENGTSPAGGTRGDAVPQEPKPPIAARLHDEAELGAHAKTQEMLALVLQRLPEPGFTAASSKDAVARFLSGKGNGLLGLVSNLAGASLFFLAIGAFIWALLAHLPRLLPGIVGIIVPFGLFTVGAVTVLLAGRCIKRKLTRMRVLTGVLICYSASTVIYLLSLSLSFLRYNTFPSGFLLACSLLGTVSISRRALHDVMEMMDMIRNTSA